MQSTDGEVHPKRWFDGSTARSHLRDGLRLFLRVLLLTASLGCL